MGEGVDASSHFAQVTFGSGHVAAGIFSAPAVAGLLLA